jgi:hypothetical protein
MSRSLASRPRRQELSGSEPRCANVPNSLCDRAVEGRPPLETAPPGRRLPAVLLQRWVARQSHRPGLGECRGQFIRWRGSDWNYRIARNAKRPDVKKLQRRQYQKNAYRQLSRLKTDSDGRKLFDRASVFALRAAGRGTARGRNAHGGRLVLPQARYEVSPPVWYAPPTCERHNAMPSFCYAVQVVLRHTRRGSLQNTHQPHKEYLCTSSRPQGDLGFSRTFIRRLPVGLTRGLTHLA